MKVNFEGLRIAQILWVPHSLEYSRAATKMHQNYFVIKDDTNASTASAINSALIPPH